MYYIYLLEQINLFYITSLFGKQGILLLGGGLLLSADMIPNQSRLYPSIH